MRNRIIRGSFFSVTSCILFFLFCTELTYADTQIQWNRQGAGEITCGVTEWERDFCGGVEGYVLALTQTDYTTHRYQDYASCPGKYDLVSGITFAPPPSTIVGQEVINLKANGTQTGTRDCCFIGDWFKYSVSCDGSGYGLSPVADDEEKRTVDLMDSVNEVVNISDDLDINLYLPGSTSIANECVITGWASGGCSIKWVYSPTVVEIPKEPDTKITAFEGPTKVVCSNSYERIYTITITNHGDADDSGHVVFGSGANVEESDSAYNLAPNETKIFTFKAIFPEDMYSSDDHGLFISTTSNINSNSHDSAMKKIQLICRDPREQSFGTSGVYLLLLLDDLH